MTLIPTDPVALTQALIRCESVTPREGGALTLLQNVLEPAGFLCHRLPFSELGTPDVDNLYARLGTGRPHLCFAGHTDVVPIGNEAAWKFPPFGGNQQRIGNPSRLILDGISDLQAQWLAITEHLHKKLLLFTAGNQKNIFNSSKHENRKRIINQWQILR